MELTSPAYLDGETMPARFATLRVTGGTGTSVPLSWSGPPAGTRSFVIAMIDVHPVAQNWVHWLVADLPESVRSVAEGASLGPGMPAGSIEFRNTGGTRGYGGPQPPVGSGVHDYVVNLYALDTPRLGIGPDASWEDVRSSMAGHLLDATTLVGRFGR